MHGNTPYAGPPSDGEVPAERVEALRDDLTALTARTRSLLPDEFVVGSELSEGTDGPRATIAVQPPVGNVVSTGLPAGATEEERDDLAVELAAGAALQVRQALDEIPPTAG